VVRGMLLHPDKASKISKMLDEEELLKRTH
jgi:hypothetical protein